MLWNLRLNGSMQATFTGFPKWVFLYRRFERQANPMIGIEGEG
jgi:hypothetical protein